jgi:hypothetical protein
MSVNYSKGTAYVPDTLATYGKGYFLAYADSGANVPIAASNGSNPRIDLICLVVSTSGESGATPSTVEVQDITGTPATSPVPPTAPNNSITLAQIAVGAGVTSITQSNITQIARSITPVFRGSSNGGQAVSNATQTSLSLSTINEDSVSGYDTSTGNYTVKVAGLYVCSAGVGWNNNNLAFYQIAWFHNGNQETTDAIGINPSTDVALIQNVTHLARCAVNDTLVAQIYQNAGGPLTTDGYAHCSIVWVGR